MRLCLVSQEYPPETAHGGIGAQTYVKAHGMARLGHDVTVLSHSLDQDRHVKSDGAVRVVRIPSADARLPIATEAVRWLSYSLEVAAELARLEAEQPFDLIDFPEWAAEGYVHLLNRAGAGTTPSLVHLHGPLVMFAEALSWPDKDSEFYRTGSMMEAACLRLADAVISSSDCSAEWVARSYGLKRAEIATVHTGVDRSLFKPSGEAKAERPTIVFVGKIAANKGVEPLAQAALALAAEVPGLRLQLIGRGDDGLRDRLLETARAHGREGLIEPLGFVHRDELPAILSRGHVFAAPSVYEGGPGFVYLEAMACGLPVVACAGSGPSEAVRHDENGLLVPPNDLEALTAALRRLLTDEPLRARLAAGGLGFVAAEADSEQCLRRLEAVYAEVAQRRRSAP